MLLLSFNIFNARWNKLARMTNCCDGGYRSNYSGSVLLALDLYLGLLECL